MSLLDDSFKWANKLKEIIKIAVAEGKIEEVDDKEDSLVQEAPPSLTLGGAKIKRIGSVGVLEEIVSKLHLPKVISDDVLADKKKVAEVIYRQLRFKYGFVSSLDSGNFAPFPHQVTSVTCSTQMFVNYVVAEVCGLSPRIFDFGGFRGRGEDFIAAHSMIQVDVGDSVPWIICQNFGGLGPVTWGERELTIHDIDRGDRRYEFTFVDEYTGMQFADLLEYQQSDEGAASVLAGGQRVGVFDIDGWKSKKVLPAYWHLNFNPKNMTLVSLIQLNRPLVRNRGLENLIQISPDGSVACETFNGWFYSENGFAELINPVLMVTIPEPVAARLVQGLKELSIDDQFAFESKLHRIVMDGPKDKDEERIYESIQGSFNIVLGTKYKRAVRKFVLTEALYLNHRGNRRYVYNEDARYRSFLSSRDSDARSVVRANKIRDRILRHRARMDRVLRSGQTMLVHGGRVSILRPQQRDSESVLRFAASRDSNDLLAFYMEHNPEFNEEAADRTYFAFMEIKPRLDKLETDAERMSALESFAQEKFGGDVEKHLFGAYARIFGEFLGEMAYAHVALRCDSYLPKILRKIKSYVRV